MAKMKSCGAKGYAEGGEMSDDTEDMSEKRAGSRRASPARPAPRLPPEMRQDSFVPHYNDDVKSLLSPMNPRVVVPRNEMMNDRYRMRPMTDQSRQNLKGGGAIRGGGVESKGKTKGRFV
jgi:hypothetical protein